MSPNVKESQLRLNLLTAPQAASLEGVGLVKREAVLVMIIPACQYLLTMASGYSPPFWKVYINFGFINKFKFVKNYQSFNDNLKVHYKRNFP